MLPIRPTRDNSTLSISSPHINHCQDVAEYMRKCKIPCHVVSNYTVVAPSTQPKQPKQPKQPEQKEYIIEKGCQIKFGAHHPYLINPLFWSKLKNTFQLQCAHLEVEGKFKGCIYDYFSVSKCPPRWYRGSHQKNTTPRTRKMIGLFVN